MPPSHSEAPVAALPRDPRAAAWAPGLLIVLAVFLFLLRWGGPSNLTDNDQERPASYVLDAVANGNWLVQRDWTGDITSKPPLYTWLAGLASLPTGRVSLFTLYLPCALAIAGTAWLALRATTTLFGWRTGFLAGWFVLINPLSAKLIALARTDAVFTFAVSLTAVLAFRAWTQPLRRWITPWLAASAATLTKGPLGLWMGFCGLAAAFARGESRETRPRLGPQLAGLALLLALAGGWFALAYLGAGAALVDKMLKAELVQHAMRPGDTPRALGLILAPTYVLTRFAPWSLLVPWALYRLFRRRGVPDSALRFERFCGAWLAGGCLMLALASHQRGDLVSPLVLPGAVLAACVAEPWLHRLSDRAFLMMLAIVGIAAAVGIQIQHQGRARDTFATSAGCARLAGEFLAAGGDPKRLLHVDTPYALQFHLQTMHRSVSAAEAAARLKDDPTLSVAVADRGAWEAAWADAARPLRSIARWPTPPAAVRYEILRPLPPAGSP